MARKKSARCMPLVGGPKDGQSIIPPMPQTPEVLVPYRDGDEVKIAVYGHVHSKLYVRTHYEYLREHNGDS